MTDTTIWHDITGLTTEQAEQLSQGGHLMPEAELIELAREMAQQNRLQASLAHIPAPAGAVHVTAWFDDGETTSRIIYGTAWNVGNVNARIIGDQDSDGVTVWKVEFNAVYGTVGDLTAVQAREMAAALVHAADELDKLTGDAPPFM